MKETKSKHLNSVPYASSDCPDIEELTNKFGPKKSDSLILSQIYSDICQTNRSLRVANCGTYLEFSHDFNSETGEFSDKGRLSNANFCRDLLCPMCNWRKSLRQIADLSLVLNHESVKDKYKVLMMTLTIPNVPFDDLSSGIDKLFHGFDLLMKNRKYKRFIKGYFRSLEVTTNLRSSTFHPHLHVLLLVSLSYGKKGDDYISHAELLNDWRSAVRDPSVTQVDIRRAYTKNGESYNLSAAALEVAKYAAKIPTRCYQPIVVQGLLNGLSHRRTKSYGGVLKSAFQALRLNDIEDADLVHINDDVPSPVMSLIIRYGWSASGYQVINTRMEGGNADDSFKVC